MTRSPGPGTGATLIVADDLPPQIPVMAGEAEIVAGFLGALIAELLTDCPAVVDGSAPLANVPTSSSDSGKNAGR